MAALNPVFGLICCLLLAQFSTSTFHMRTVVRCAELNNRNINNLIKVCQVGRKIYYIQELYNDKNAMFWEWTAKTSDGTLVTLIMADIQYSPEMIKAYDIQRSIYARFNQTAFAYHMVQYYAISEMRKNDTCIVLVKARFGFPFDDLKLFADYASEILNGSDMNTEEKERFAVHETLTLLKHASIPLEFVGTTFGVSYGAISENKICVTAFTQNGYAYYLSGLEDLVPSKFWIKKSVHDLVWIAWRYYAQLCHQNMLLYVSDISYDKADGINIVSLKGSGINAFCNRSKALYDQKSDNTGPFPDSLKKQQSLVRELMANAKKDVFVAQNITYHCIEYLLFEFIELCGHAPSMAAIDWRTFNKRMDVFAHLLPYF